jgi:hypothetical protein
MEAKGKRRVIVEMLDKLKADMLAAVEQMPDDWDETELGWYLGLLRITPRRRRPASPGRTTSGAPSGGVG